MGAIVNYGFILNSSLEVVEIEMRNFLFTPHLDYCINYIQTKATEQEKQAFKKFARRQRQDYEESLSIYEDFCLMVLDWIKVGNGTDMNVVQCNFKHDWQRDALQEWYKDFRKDYVVAVDLEEVLKVEDKVFLENGIIFPEYTKNPNVKSIRLFLNPRLFTAFESSSEEEMEDFCKQYLCECDNSYVQEALKKYELQSTVRTPTFYLDFCIGAFEWCRVKTDGEQKIFYDAGESLWNFRILSSYQDEGYKVEFVPQIEYPGKKKRAVMY